MGVADKVAVALKALGKERGLPNKFLCSEIAERAGILSLHVPVALRSLKSIRVGGKDWSLCVRRIKGRSWVKVQ